MSLSRWSYLLVAALLAVATCVTFLPAVGNDFVWDDEAMFLINPSYRGLGWTQIKWMFTTFHMVHYTPVTWLTLGLDYVLWGMSPVGYHVTNVLFHAANAVALYAVAVRLLRLAAGKDPPPTEWRVVAGAAFGALVFAVHPLRVESVAWATERRDVVSALFYLLAVHAYLRWAEGRTGPEQPRRAWYGLSLGFFVLAVLSKAPAVTLPAVLIILDFYPLGSLRGGPRGWFGRDSRWLWAEKVPFILVSLAGSAVAVVALVRSGDFMPLTTLGPAARLAAAVYGVAFYLWKTIVPLRLSPLYEFHPETIFGGPLVVASVVVAVATMLAVGLRRRYPFLLAVWASYLLMLSPMLRSIQDAYHIAADRYTYLPGLGWAVLAGGLLSHGLGIARRDGGGQRARVALGAFALAITGVLAALTWQQTRVWHDWESLWSHVLRLDPRSAVAHNNLGQGRSSQGRVEEAEASFRRATEIDPRYVVALHNLGVTLADRGEWAGAAEQFQRAVQLRPGFLATRFKLALVLIQLDRPLEAIEHFRAMLSMTSDTAAIHNGWGVALERLGRTEEAIEHFRAAMDLAPDYTEARQNWAAALSRQADSTKQDRPSPR